MRVVAPLTETRMNTMTKNEDDHMDKTLLLEKVGEAVRAIAPDCRVVLLGSHARGDARPDADWDILIIASQRLSPESKRRIRYAIYDIEWSEGEAICAHIIAHSDWQNPRNMVTPFYRNVAREGIAL